MKVKICGITNADDALMCESLGSDAIGFVHYPGKSRSLPIEVIERIASTLGPMIIKVLVCSPMTSTEAIHLARRANVDAVQVSSLSPKDLQKIRAQGFKVIRGVHPDRTEALKFVDACDAILFDGRNPGSGESYDYSKIPMDLCERAIIAGGLNVDNLHLAKSLNPYCLDVSSGVERIKGRKDPELVAEFIRRCKL